jgi:t-SNARE complex subunit (syntaxin)
VSDEARIYDLIDAHRRETREQLERIHGRMDDMLKVGERIATLEARFGDLKETTEAHAQLIDTLRDTTRGSARLAVGGAGAGGLALVVQAIKSLVGLH